MENNQVEWIMVKKATSKENRKTLIKTFLYAGLFLASSWVFMILTFELLVWFWNASLTEQMAQIIRSWA